MTVTMPAVPVAVPAPSRDERRWWLTLFATTGAVLTAAWPAFAVGVRRTAWYAPSRRLRRHGSNLILRMNGVTVEVSGLDAVDWSTPCVICPNHASYLDMSALMRAMPVDPVFISKTDVADMPLVGIFSRGLDIPVSREIPRQAHAALSRALDALAAGTSVVIFPEGAFAGPPETLSHFFNGAFKLAIRAQVPVVPVTICNSWNILPDGIRGGASGDVRVVFHAPVPVTGMRLRRGWLSSPDVYALRDRVKAVIQATLDDYCGAPGYRNRWTGTARGIDSIPEYKTLTPYLAALLRGNVR